MSDGIHLHELMETGGAVYVVLAIIYIKVNNSDTELGGHNYFA